jgi:hypothetical protein
MSLSNDDFAHGILAVQYRAMNRIKKNVIYSGILELIDSL